MADPPDPAWPWAPLATGPDDGAHGPKDAGLWLEHPGPPDGVHAMILERAVAAVRLVLDRTRGRAPADDELAVLLGVTEDDIRQARQAGLAFSASSLDAPLSGQDDAAPLGDMLGEDDQAIEHAIDMEAVRAHLDDLPEREQRILNLRFYGNLTQAEIGRRLGISQMHVSRLLTRALAYLRHQLTSEPGRGTVMARELSTTPAPPHAG